MYNTCFLFSFALENTMCVYSLKVVHLLPISATLILYHTKSEMLLFLSLSLSIPHTHKVTNLKVVNITTSSTTITWDQPPHNYRVFLHGEATDNIPQSRVIQLVDVTGQTTHIVEGLYPFRNYSIGVFLASDNGNGIDATVIVNTIGRGEGKLLCSYRSCMKALCVN